MGVANPVAFTSLAGLPSPGSSGVHMPLSGRSRVFVGVKPVSVRIR